MCIRDRVKEAPKEFEKVAVTVIPDADTGSDNKGEKALKDYSNEELKAMAVQRLVRHFIVLADISKSIGIPIVYIESVQSGNDDISFASQFNYS